MTVLIFLLGLALGVCLYAIARWVEYFVEVRREDRQKFTHSRSGQHHG